MLRDYALERDKRVAFIREAVKKAGASGIVFGSSGGKDSALVGILCKLACDDTVGVIMPCQSRRNYEEDTVDALELGRQYNIRTITIDLSPVKQALVDEASKEIQPSPMSLANIGPRLRMTTLYTVAASENLLVAGTGNRSEIYMGYFTKYGDGGYDINPIADLTATEVFEFLRFLNAPEAFLTKAPSAALFEGQTDEQEMGLTYDELDGYILTGEGQPEVIAKIESAHAKTEHKRRPALIYTDPETK